MHKLQLTLLLGIIFILFGFFILKSTAQPSTSSQSTPITTRELSSDEYKKIRDELTTILSEKDPRVALATLREKAQTDNAISRSCHSLVHEIGHEAYEKYGDFGQAMQYQDDMCNSGYLHGIIESHFGTSQDIVATMQTVCSNYNPTTFIGWECFHGVGHGLMYFTENDLPKSLSLCESYTDTSSQMPCVNGVFMENFNVDQKLHVSKYVNPKNPMYPCNGQKYEYKGDCYLYAPAYFLSLHKNAYAEALAWCKTAENDFQLACIHGVGSQAIKENINNPKFVEALCMQGTSAEKDACLTGMAGLAINHFGGVEETKKMCSKLEKSNQKICEEVVISREYLF